MYTVKSNPYDTKGFKYRYINELEIGFFYEDKAGERYLVIGKKSPVNKVYCFKISNPFQVLSDYDKYELRLVTPGEEITFVQSEPIPF